MAKHESSEVRRAQILRAAVEMCAEKGYHASRIDDIATRAGLSKGAVYHHFASKQEVFLGVIEMMVAWLRNQVGPQPPGGVPLVFTNAATYDCAGSGFLARFVSAERRTIRRQHSMDNACPLILKTLKRRD